MDGWNKVTHVTGTGVDISYGYDGLGDMAVRTDNLAATGMAATTFFYYAGPQMIQSVQQTPASPADGATTVTDQYVYSPRYVNSPILDTQTVSTYSASTTSWSAASGSYYFLTDANYNVTALLNSSGAVIERYVYSAYGTATVYSPDYSTTYSASTVGNTVSSPACGSIRQLASADLIALVQHRPRHVHDEPSCAARHELVRVQRRRPRRRNRPHRAWRRRRRARRAELHRAEFPLQFRFDGQP